MAPSSSKDFFYANEAIGREAIGRTLVSLTYTVTTRGIANTVAEFSLVETNESLTDRQLVLDMQGQGE